MTQQFNASPAFRVPDVSPEVSSNTFTAPATQSAEQLPSRPEMQPMPQLVPSAQAPVQQPIPQALLPDSDVQQPAQATTQSDADIDDKAIEEEWVSKAKAIVAQTQSDPYREAYELSKLKADYLSSRHNKQIKVKDAPAL